jgi:hypothetical protein
MKMLAAFRNFDPKAGINNMTHLRCVQGGQVIPHPPPQPGRLLLESYAMSTDAQLADTMTAAFRTVCKSIGATKAGPYATEIVATKIVELAKYGLDDPKLSRRVLKDLHLIE